MNKNRKYTKPSRKRRNHTLDDTIIIFLSDGPKNIAQLEQYYLELPRRFGMFIELFDQAALEQGHLTENIYRDLEKLESDGLVEQLGESYQLTASGQAYFEKQSIDLGNVEYLVKKLGSPETVGKVSLALHLMLAAVKLPAGILSGSIGLINDGIDTLLDAFCSILVLFGMRFDQEKASNLFLILLMLGTGGLAMVSAIKRLFNPIQPQVDWFTFFSALASAALCTGLYLYQRFIGLRSNSLALIAQSVDSRNHIIVAGSVTVGLIAALLNFPLLDTIIGLIVAGVILFSAFQLAAETIKNLQTGEFDLSHFTMGITERYNRFRQNQLYAWLLFIIKEENLHNREEIKQRALKVMDFRANPGLAQIGMDNKLMTENDIEKYMAGLIQNGWLQGSQNLALTKEGRKYLGEALQQGKYGRRHSPNKI